MKTGASAAARYGLDMDSTAAALGRLNSADIMGSEAGTSLSAVLRQLNKAQEEWGDIIQRDPEGALDLVATLQRVKEEIENAGDIDAQSALIQEIFGAEGLTPLMTNLQALRKDIDAVGVGSKGVVAAYYENFREKGSGPFAILKNAYSVTGLYLF